MSLKRIGSCRIIIKARARYCSIKNGIKSQDREGFVLILIHQSSSTSVLTNPYVSILIK